MTSDLTFRNEEIQELYTIEIGTAKILTNTYISRRRKKKNFILSDFPSLPLAYLYYIPR